MSGVEADLIRVQRDYNSRLSSEIVMAMNPEFIHALRCDEARAAWRIYYRAVRILRKLRLDDRNFFMRMSQCWWHAVYKFEVCPPGTRRPPRKLP